MTMRANALSSRERVRLALAHQTPDRVPIALICSGINEPVRTAVDARLRAERGVTLDAWLDEMLDVAQIGAPYIGPALPAGVDIWGVRRVPVSFGAESYSEIVHHPLAAARTVADLAAHPWPTPALFDYAALPRIVAESRRHRDRALMIANANPFESAWYLRGLEQAYVDMVENPDFLHALMARVTDFHAAHFERLLSAAPGEIDLAFTADDIGGQSGLLLSLDMWREFIRPHHVRLNRLIHGFGAKVVYHTDGAVMEAVPELIEAGIDVLQALQFDAAGMDPDRLKREHGDRLAFCGGVSVQRTLPFGSPAQVREEVRQRVSVLGAGGGYILGPSHAIQAGTPVENVLAFFDAALG
jgi:uroporphyrinogen decarboxylase